MPHPFSRLLSAIKGTMVSTARDSVTQSKGENPLVMIVALLIALLVGASLWVSVGALREKVRFSHALQQVIDIVAAVHDTSADRHFDETRSEDLLAILQRLGRITPTGESGEMQTLTNPWSGSVAASTMPEGHIRIETIMPSKKCRRMVDLFDQNLKPLGLEQIAVKNSQDAWVDVYTGLPNNHLSDAQMTALCSNLAQTDMALTFSVH